MKNSILIFIKPGNSLHSVLETYYYTFIVRIVEEVSNQWDIVLALHQVFGDSFSSYSQIISFCALLFWLVVDIICVLLWYYLLTSFDHSWAISLGWMTCGFYSCFEGFLMLKIWCSLITSNFYIYCSISIFIVIYLLLLHKDSCMLRILYMLCIIYSFVFVLISITKVMIDK